MAIEDLPSSFSAFAVSRTPPITDTSPILANLSMIRLPVWPVAPATRMVLGDAA